MDRKILQKSNPYSNQVIFDGETKTIHYGEVVWIDDDSDGMIIKVRIPKFDNNIPNNNLPDAYPLLPKYFHVLPQVGEIVRVFIEDITYPNRGRLWLGSVISQPHKISYDGYYTALSTTDMGLTNPEKSPSTFINAKGIYPNKKDVGLIGRSNNDIILRENGTVLIRTGKHVKNEPLEINKTNPGQLILYNSNRDDDKTTTECVLMSNKIALISHNENKTFKSIEMNVNEIDEMFSKLYSIPRGENLVEFLELIRKAVLLHVHGYSNLKPDKNEIIKDLEKYDITKINNKNIVIN